MAGEATIDEGARLAKRIALASVAIAVVVLGVKYAAYAVTGSVALFSDALESIVNVVAGLIALWAITISYKPADNDHPFGHTKAEYFSAVVEGVLIASAAVWILVEAWDAFRNPRIIEMPIVGLAINGVATVANFGWAMYLIRLSRAKRSPAFAADGRHLMADVVTSVGVIAGLGIATWTSIPVLDPILAAIVALNVLREGFKVVSHSLSSLMDQAMEPAEEAQVREIISSHAVGAIEVHDLRTRLSGRMIFIEFHLVVPSEMTVGASHVICDRIEEALAATFTTANIQIHVEPEEEAQATGIPVI
ncbi:cation diffusion facilitator family transporter [Fulvimarina sp. 2208YS6-2-32]|uniref:Cation diffusion facilitator family transporter n=1 Tax=Fulvimarina uroteuthidis TaxID=3098149 RepID=A0ABU5I5E6_9HYPH|nr:cation diffusion facilitator family transporter [Fulvimarina sp. 2208YS6-2-32]MDY8110335.1 cation diffusion facilitator family transporter [Fulvimarina sp. 2208YS6-2-32]